MSVNENVKKSKKKKSKKSKKNKKIIFDEEIITKDAAKNLLIKEQDAQNEVQQQEVKPTSIKQKKKKNKTEIKEEQESKINDVSIEELQAQEPSKKKKQKASKQTEPENTEELGVQESIKKRKRKASKQTEQPTDESNTNDDLEDTNVVQPQKKTEESIRAKKRRKYAELLQNKKLQTELALQQKSLNYLSQWKHNRNEWKFEKLRQIWLQQNMYDTSKISDKFWDTVVEYFSNSKGKVKELIINEAIKNIESIESKLDEADENLEVKLTRSRHIVQNLQ